jgi:hypothetical protein
VTVALVAAAMALLGARTGAVFDGGAPPVAVVAPLAPALVALLVPDRARWLRVAAGMVAVVAASAAAVGSHGGALPGDLAQALVRGLATNLAANWPVAATPVAVGGVVAALALASVVAVELAAGRQPGGVVLAPVAAAVGLLALLSAPAGPPPPGPSVAFAVALVGVLRAAHLARRPPARRAGNAGRRLGPPVAAVGVVGLGVVAAAAALDGLQRWDPRLTVTTPAEATVTISPLSLVDGWRRIEPAQVLFRTDGPPTGERWRLVGLTRYDGRSWMPAGDYRPAARRLAPDQGGATRRHQVTIEQLRSPWLPVPDRPLAITAEVSVDRAGSGLLLDTVPLTGFRYEVEAAAGERPAPDLAARAVQPAAGPVLVDGVVVPAGLVEKAVAYTAGARNDYERAALLAAGLRRDHPFDPEAPGGHSLVVLERFVEPGTPGSEEQFVAAYAVMAAAVGLPVRVVVGFELQEAAPGSEATTAGVRAWPEVHFEGHGWTAFDPLPGSRDPVSGIGERAAAPPPAGAAPVPPTTAPPPPTTVPPASDDEPDAGGDGAAGLALAVPAAVGLPVVLVAAYVAAVLALKRRRRRRRRAEGPDRAVTGALTTAVETLVDLGARPSPSHTNRELVAVGRSVVGDGNRSLDRLAELATAAVFARDEPAEHDADTAWSCLAAFERDAAGTVGRTRWARSRLSPRSLRRRV